MSDSVRPNRWQPTRLLHPWDFPGRKMECGAIAFSPVLYSGSLLIIYFIYNSVYISIPISLFIHTSPFPLLFKIERFFSFHSSVYASVIVCVFFPGGNFQDLNLRPFVWKLQAYSFLNCPPASSRYPDSWANGHTSQMVCPPISSP